MSFTSNPCYTSAANHLHTRSKPVPRKKVANNTYLERRTDESIALVLHNTDVVTYHLDGRIVLDTGGWLTVTTKDRINAGLPRPWHLSSNKGTWELREGYGYVNTITRYTDGITLHEVGEGSLELDEDTCLPASQREKDDAHNTTIQRLIGKYLKAYTEYDEDAACRLCMILHTTPHAHSDREVYVLVGDGMEDTQHLIDHMLDGHYPYTLLLAAISERGYNAEVVIGHRDIAKRSLRGYLGARLLRGATAGANGRKPVTV